MKDKHLITILSNMVNDLIGAQAPGYRGNTTEGICDASSYPFIPMAHHRNIETFYKLKKRLPDIKRWSGHRFRDPDNQKFLDAGCGIGNVMVTAKAVRLCGHWHGIEYFEETYKKAEAWLGIGETARAYRTPPLRIFRDDILTFPNYEKYDVIYFYCPFSDHQLQVRFEERLEDEMKVGAILVPFMKQGWAIKKDNRFKRINGISSEGAVWIKVRKGERQVSDTPRLKKPWEPARVELYEKKYAEYYKELAER